MKIFCVLRGKVPVAKHRDIVEKHSESYTLSYRSGLKPAVIAATVNSSYSSYKGQGGKGIAGAAPPQSRGENPAHVQGSPK